MSPIAEVDNDANKEETVSTSERECTSSAEDVTKDTKDQEQSGPHTSTNETMSRTFLIFLEMTILMFSGFY